MVEARGKGVVRRKAYYASSLSLRMMENYGQLQVKDQLSCFRDKHTIFSRFDEGPLNFDPTYKYNDHSMDYDTTSEPRIPSWTDRILWEPNGTIVQHMYGRKESLFSDHRPVIALFEL